MKNGEKVKRNLRFCKILAVPAFAVKIADFVENCGFSLKLADFVERLGRPEPEKRFPRCRSGTSFATAGIIVAKAVPIKRYATFFGTVLATWHELCLTFLIIQSLNN